VQVCSSDDELHVSGLHARELEHDQLASCRGDDEECSPRCSRTSMARELAWVPTRKEYLLS
jgi:hypothetical protein